MTTTTTGRRSGPTAQLPRPVLVLGALGLAGVVGLLSGCGVPVGDPEGESKSFETPSDRLVIVSDYDLSVRTHSGDSIEVERQVQESWNPTWTLEDNTLELRADPPNINFGSTATGSVMVPEGVEVEVRMPNSDLDVTDVADGLTVHKTNGDVRLTDVLGSVGVTMTNGDIGLNAAKPLDEVRLRTKNGDVDAHLKGDETYDIAADTVNGDVAVGVKREEGADRTIDASSTNGDITIDRR